MKTYLYFERILSESTTLLVFQCQSPKNPLVRVYLRVQNGQGRVITKNQTLQNTQFF